VSRRANRRAEKLAAFARALRSSVSRLDALEQLDDHHRAAAMADAIDETVAELRALYDERTEVQARTRRIVRNIELALEGESKDG
jgi:uncharacterized protein YeeX (DUF496 family)